MQPDENCVRSQGDGVRHTILTRGQVDSAVLIDRFLERGGIVGDTITNCAKRADIDPGVNRWQIQDVGFDRCGQCSQWCCLVYITDRWRAVYILIVKPMRKSLHLVYF